MVRTHSSTQHGWHGACCTSVRRASRSECLPTAPRPLGLTRRLTPGLTPGRAFFWGGVLAVWGTAALVAASGESSRERRAGLPGGHHSGWVLLGLAGEVQSEGAERPAASIAHGMALLCGFGMNDQHPRKAAFSLGVQHSAPLRLSSPGCTRCEDGPCHTVGVPLPRLRCSARPGAGPTHH